LGRYSHGDPARANAYRTIATDQVTTCSGKIFASRLRTKAAVPRLSEHRQVSRNPLSTKKNDTPVQPPWPSSEAYVRAHRPSAKGLSPKSTSERWNAKTGSAASQRSPVRPGSGLRRSTATGVVGRSTGRDTSVRRPLSAGRLVLASSFTPI
jgi:hypothetical protein